jgi:hypothetical protein
MKRQYFAVLDTETTLNDTVMDFAIVVCDRHGKIYNSCSVLVREFYDPMTLFHDKNNTGFWSNANLERRRANYQNMLDSGTRMLASVTAINNWINKCIGTYDPILTAYNLAFDANKCANSGIVLDSFTSRFCLWQAAVGNICRSKKYKRFVLDNHRFNNATDKGNMTFKTDAETVAGFVTGNLITEPHTALEDARDFEIPILQKIVRSKGWRDRIEPYDWKKFQVKDHYNV